MPLHNWLRNYSLSPSRCSWSQRFGYVTAVLEVEVVGDLGEEFAEQRVSFHAEHVIVRAA